MEEFCRNVTRYIVMHSHEIGLAMQFHVTRSVEKLCVEYLNDPTHTNFNITVCKIHEELITAYERINKACDINLDAISITMLHSLSDIILDKYDEDFDFGGSCTELQNKLLGDNIVMDPRIPKIRRLIASLGANVCCTEHGAKHRYYQKLFEIAMAKKSQSTAKMLNDSLAHIVGNLDELRETFKSHLVALGRHFNE